MHVLLLLKIAFSLWMLTDAIKRGAPTWWYFLIFFPLGAVAYFLLVKVRDFEPAARKLLTRPVTIADLERNLRLTASVENEVVLAQALHDAGRFSEAGAGFERALDQAPNDRQALYGYALCCAEVNRVDVAIDALEQVVDADFTFRNFEAVYALARMYWQKERYDEAMEWLRRVVRSGTLLEPRVHLGKCMIERGQHDEAVLYLRAALDSYEQSPRFVRRRDRHWARVALGLLRTAESKSAAGEGRAVSAG